MSMAESGRIPPSSHGLSYGRLVRRYPREGLDQREDGLDRRTDRPDGSGGASPTVVTSRATGDDMIGDDQDTRPSDIMATPRRPSRQSATPAPAQTATPDDATSDGTPGGGPSANGAPAGGTGIDGTKDASANGGPAPSTAKDTSSAAASDGTVADGVPAFPADSIGASRGGRSREPDPDPDTKADDKSVAEDSPAFSFGRPASAPVRLGAEG